MSDRSASLPPDYEDAIALLDAKADRIGKKRAAWWIPDHGLVINQPFIGGFNLWVWSILKLFPTRGSYFPADPENGYAEGIVIRPMWQSHPKFRNDQFPETVESVEKLLKYARGVKTVQQMTRDGFAWIEKEYGITIPGAIETKYVNQAPKIAKRRWSVDRVRMKDTFVPFDGGKAVPMPSWGRPMSRQASPLKTHVGSMLEEMHPMDPMRDRILDAVGSRKR